MGHFQFIRTLVQNNVFKLNIYYSIKENELMYDCLYNVAYNTVDVSGEISVFHRVRLVQVVRIVGREFNGERHFQLVDFII